MNIDDLKPSISSMSTEELMSLLRDVRGNRRVSKRKEEAAKKSVTKTKQSILDMIANSGDKEALIKMLEESL